MARVSEVMNKNFAVVAPSASAVEVARKMREHQTGFVMVCEQGKLKGTITEEGIISAIVAMDRNPKRESAASMMQDNIPRTLPGADITEAAKLMARHAIRFIPVVEKGKLVGVVTLHDLTRESPALAFMVMTRSFDKHEWKGKDSKRFSGKDMAYVC